MGASRARVLIGAPVLSGRDPMIPSWTARARDGARPASVCYGFHGCGRASARRASRPPRAPRGQPSSARSATRPRYSVDERRRHPARRCARGRSARPGSPPRAGTGRAGRPSAEARRSSAAPSAISARIPQRGILLVERRPRPRSRGPAHATARTSSSAASPHASGSVSSRLASEHGQPARLVGERFADRARPDRASRSRTRRRSPRARPSGAAGMSARVGTANGMPASRMRRLARTSRCAIAARLDGERARDLRRRRSRARSAASAACGWPGSIAGGRRRTAARAACRGSPHARATSAATSRSLGSQRRLDRAARWCATRRSPRCRAAGCAPR